MMLRKLLELLRGLDLATLIGLFNLPDLKDEAACRLWCRDLAALLEKLADLTPIDQDDLAADALVAIVADDEAWGALYGLIVSLLRNPERMAAIEDVDLAASRVGVNPMVILAIIKLIVELLRRFWPDEDE